MSVRTDTVNLVVNINGNQAQNNLNELRKRSADIKAEMQGLTKGTAEYIAKAEELKKVNSEMDALKKQIGITSLSQKELVAELNKLKALKGSVVPFSAEFKDLQKQIEAVESRLYDVRNGVQGFSSWLSKISDEVKQFGLLAAAYLGFEFITDQFQSIISGSARLSDSLADIRRVSGLSSEEVLKLNTQLSELNTRTSTEGLREIAVIAGKLGVAKNDIFDFTAAVDQLVVSLGDELGDADQITTQLGKILNVFDGKVTGDNISRLGNSFVELANAGVASGGFIADFTQRVSGIAKSANISLGSTVGLGAGLEELGQRSESSATAIQKLVSTIGADIPKAAKIAGAKSKEDVQKFANDFARAPQEVLIRFAEALTKNKASFSEVANSFKDAGEEGARVVGVLQAIGQNGDFMRQKIDLGNESLKNTNAISEAFALKNETFGATIDKLGKEFAKLTNSTAVTGFLQGAAQGALKFIEAIRGIPKFIDDNSTALKLLLAGIALLNLSYIKSAGVIVLDTVAKVQNAVATRATAFATAAAEVAQAAYITVVTLLTGRITLATAAQRLWAISLSVGLGPLGILLTLVGAVVVAFNSFADSSARVNSQLAFQAETFREASKELAKQKAELDGLTAVVKDNSVSLGTREATLKKLIAISPEYLGRLTLENIATQEGKDILDKYNKSLEVSANLKAAAAIKERETQKDIELRTAKQQIEIAAARARDSGDLSGALESLRGTGTSKYFEGGADPFKKALENVQAEIDLQAKNVKASTDNYVNQTKEVESARRRFLVGEISAAQSALVATKEGTKEYEAALAKRNAARKKFQDEFGKKEEVQSSTDVVIPTGDDAKKNAEKARKDRDAEFERLKKDAEKFQQDLLDIKRRAQIKGEEPEQREIDAAAEKYKKLSQQLADFVTKGALTKKQGADGDKLIEEALQAELLAIRQKYFKKSFEESEAKRYEDALTARNEFSEKQKQAAALQFAEDKISKEQYEASLTKIERDELQDRLIIAGEYSGTVKKAAADVVKFTKTQEEQATKDYITETTKRKELSKDEALAKGQRNVLTTKDGTEARLQAQKDLLQLQFDLEQKHADKTSEMYLLKEQQLQDAKAALDKEYNQKRIDQALEYVNAFQSALDNVNKLITNGENAQLAKDKQANDSKKKNFKDQLDNRLISKQQYDRKVSNLDDEYEQKERALRRRQAEREKALALFGALVNTATAVVKALPNIPLSILAGVIGGLQVAAIANSPLPELGDGDWIRKGDKHSDPSGGILAKIERDEAVMKARAMLNPEVLTVTGTTAQITSALNGRAGGATWATGAVLQMPSWATEMPRSINGGMPKIMEQGGIVRPMNPDASPAADPFAAMVAEMRALREDVNNWRTKVKGEWYIKDLDDTRAQYDAAKKASGF